MAILAMKCPECHGDIELDDKKEFGFCMYCGTKIMVENKNKLVIDHSEEESKWIELAENAMKSGYRVDAYRYAFKVIELNPENTKAWIIRSKTTTDAKEYNFCIDQIERLNFDGNGSKSFKTFEKRDYCEIEFFFSDDFNNPNYDIKIDGEYQLFDRSKKYYRVELKQGSYEVIIRKVKGILGGNSLTLEKRLEIDEDCQYMIAIKDGALAMSRL